MRQQTPPAPADPGVTTYTATPDGRVTAADVRGLQSRLQSLRSELQDVASRRRTVADQLRNADAAARPGLENRLRLQDERITEIERQITQTTQQLGAVPPALLAEVSPPSLPFTGERVGNAIADDLVPIVAIITLFFLLPIALGLGRLFWKRASVAPRAKAAVHDPRAQQQLEHLQQSIDAIAIEVERISEGQRFMARVLNSGSSTPGSQPDARR